MEAGSLIKYTDKMKLGVSSELVLIRTRVEDLLILEPLLIGIKNLVQVFETREQSSKWLLKINKSRVHIVCNGSIVDAHVKEDILSELVQLNHNGRIEQDNYFEKSGQFFYHIIYTHK